MSNENGGAVAPAKENEEVLLPVNQREITLGWNKKRDTSPKELSVLGAVRAFVNKELKRKQDEAARDLLTDAQRQNFDESAYSSYKEYFDEKGIAGFPGKGGYQAECKIISNNWDTVNGKSIATLKKKLLEVGEKRDYKIVFAEVLETYRSEPQNKYADLLG